MNGFERLLTGLLGATSDREYRLGRLSDDADAKQIFYFRVRDERREVSVDKEHDVEPSLVVADLDARSLKTWNPFFS